MRGSSTGDHECRQAPGLFEPRVDRNRCEGQGDCAVVCPYGVFKIGVLPRAQRGELSLTGRVKGWAHGWKTAFTPNAEACQACGHCVKACPERAITLQRVQNPAHHAPTAAD